MTTYKVNDYKVQITEIGPSVFSGIVFGNQGAFANKKAVKFKWRMGDHSRAWIEPILTGIPRDIWKNQVVQELVKSACRKYAIDTAPAWAKDDRWGFPDELIAEELQLKEAA